MKLDYQAAIGVIVAVYAAIGTATAAPTLVDLGTLPGGTYSEAHGINNNGQVVGFSKTSTNVNHAVLWSNGSTVDLGTLGGSNSYANAINDLGQITGSSDLSSGGYGAFFIFSNIRRALDSPNGVSTDAMGINIQGRVIANQSICAPSCVDVSYITASNGGIWSQLSGVGVTSFGGFTSLGINDVGQVVGKYDGLTSTKRAFISGPNAGSILDIGTLGGSNVNGIGSVANAVNNGGKIVGQSAIKGDLALHAFLSGDNGVGLTDLGTLGGNNSNVKDINESGQVVGVSDTVGGTQHAFLYTGAGTLIDLNSLPGVTRTLFDARGINDYAQIAGNDANGHAYLLTLNPSWSSANGFWDDYHNWNFGGAGALVNLTPGKPHYVAINPTATSNILGPSADVLVDTLELGGGSGHVNLSLFTGTLNATNVVIINGNGTLTGSGTEQGYVINNGTIQVNSGSSIQIGGSGHENNGTINVFGTANNPAAFTSYGALNNYANGKIFVQNGNVDFHDGLTGYAGSILGVTFGTSNISGNITSGATAGTGGQILLSGNSNTTFYGRVINNGELRVSQGSTATYFGLVKGAGLFTGTGTSFYEGGFHVGNSPAQVTLDGITNYGPTNVLDMDLAGTSGPGACADCFAQLIFNGAANLDGTLKVNLFNGYTPSSPFDFTLFVFNSTHSGSFSALNLPAIAAGLVWDTSQLLNSGILSLKAAPVPLPPAVWLLITGLMSVGVSARRRSHGVDRYSTM